jgi:hypothetical protein
VDEIRNSKEKKMSEIIDTCEDISDDDNNGKMRPNIASLPLSGKRLRDKGESSESVIDPELLDETDASPNRKRRRGAARSKRSARNNGAGRYAQFRKGGEASEKDVGSKCVPVVEHRLSHDGIAAAETHPMDSDSDQISRDDGSANEHSQKRSTSKHASNAYGRPCWKDRLSELVDYRKIHGHCNVPQTCSENPKLGKWVSCQRQQYILHAEGKTSFMTASRIKELESVGFEWDIYAAAWGERLSELADYRKINGNCNVPQRYSKNPKLGTWVGTQRKQYKLHEEGNTSHLTLSRIEKLESFDFEWGSCLVAWEDRLSQLADYRKIHGHCNVPKRYSENRKLGSWVAYQRRQYKTSHLTLSRIQELEGLGFEWNPLMSGRKGTPKKSNLNDDATSTHGRDVQPNVPSKEPLEPSSCDPKILQESAVDVDTTFQQKRNDSMSNCDSNVLKVVSKEEPLQCGLRPPDERRTRSTLRATPNANLKVESESSDSDSEADANEKDDAMSMERVGQLLRDISHSDNAKVIAALDALYVNHDEDEKKCELINALDGCPALVQLLKDSLKKATEKFPQQERAQQVSEVTEAEELHTLFQSLCVISSLAAGNDESKAKISLVGGAVKAVVKVMKSFPKCHDLQMVSCCTLGNLTYSDIGAKEAVEADAMVVLLKAANNHLDIGCVCAYTCWALSNIIHGSNENTKELIRCHGATAVIKIKEKWPADIIIQTWVQSLAKAMNSWVDE